MNYQELVQNVIDGHEDPLKAYTILKNAQDGIKDCLLAIEGEVSQEAAKWEEKEFKHLGYKFTKRPGRSMYNYKQIPAWITAKDNLSEVELVHKQAYLSNQKNITSVDDNGEIIQPPIVTFTKDSLSVKKIEEVLE